MDYDTEKLYKNKYIIGIYKKNDIYQFPFAILNNEEDFSNFFKISLHNAKVKLGKIFKGRNHFLRYQDQLLEVFFIPNED